MAWVLQDIKDEMADHGFTDMLDSRMEAIINDAYFDVCSRDTWPFLELSTVANTTLNSSVVTLPTNFGSVIKAVLDGQGNALVPIRLDDLRAKYAGQLTSTGQPIYYYFIGDQMNLWPVPDAIYPITLAYLAIPTRLDNSTPGTSDVPLIPDRHRRIILLGALVSANAMEDDTDIAAWFQAQFDKRMATMSQDVWKKQWDRPDMLYSINDSYDYQWE